MLKIFSPVAGAALLAACTPSLPSAGGDPLDAAAAVPAVSYQTPFKDYVRMQPVEPLPWRALNDRMGALGGPGAHMKAGSQDDAEPAKR
jgi:hypothetical protein